MCYTEFLASLVVVLLILVLLTLSPVKEGVLSQRSAKQNPRQIMLEMQDLKSKINVLTISIDAKVQASNVMQVWQRQAARNEINKLILQRDLYTKKYTELNELLSKKIE